MNYILTQNTQRISRCTSLTGFHTLLGVVIFMLLPIGCIEPYEPVGVQDTAGILVVEGMILEKGTTIKLSKTIRLDSTLRKASNQNAVRNARVQVIDDAKNIIATAEPQIINGKINPGVYVVNGEIMFNPETKYALDIQIENKKYQSAFVSPVYTPEIDEITWRQNADKSMDVMVSTHDPENKITYFRWAFEEDWEYHAWYFGSYLFIPSNGAIIEQSLFGPNNRFYCWNSDVSKSILLGTSDKHTEATIKNRKIHNFQPNNSRFSFLYSIFVKQYGIDKEAYSYFDNLQKNIDLCGSFFAPQPTELRGNIKCISHPDEPVIGYIIATQEVASRIYIDMVRIEGEDLYPCGETKNYRASELHEAYQMGYGISHTDMGLFVCVPIRCVDCTMRGGTKNKPDFWPNDHQ